MTEESTTELYEYPLPSPCSFKKETFWDSTNQLNGRVSWDCNLNLDMIAECTIFRIKTILLVI